MRRRVVAQWLARLYPQWWRDRYGEEFGALLDECPADRLRLFDIGRGALRMQAISLFRSPWKAGAILGGVGAALLLAVTLVRPVEYRAEAVLHWRDQLSATQAVRQRLSRRALGEVIERQGLYSDERKSRPVENVIESMRKNIRIANVTTGREASGGVAFAISFQHSDPTKARSVVADLQRALDGGQGATAARANPLPVGLMVERPSYWRALWWGAVGGALVGWIGFLVGALQRRRIAARRR